MTLSLLPPPPKSYRPNVGLLVLNQMGLVWLGRRRGFRGAHCWQTPQGGIDKGEDIEKAALRELSEETGIDSSLVEIVEHTKDWLCYDFPSSMRRAKLNDYRGQAQVWFALKFHGENSHVKLDSHQQIEFDDWRWEKLHNLPQLVVPFKRNVYEQVAQRFKHLASE